jgi:DNA-binding beta-propeller fold protein YncE
MFVASVPRPDAWAEGAGQPLGVEPEPVFQQEIERQGIVIQASIVPLESANRATGQLTEGDEVSVRFRITDGATGSPLRGAFPAAWMDWLPGGDEERAKTCKRRVQRLLGGSIFSQSELDLNVFYVLALNEDPTITVVDPLFGFGGTKLLALIPLLSPGVDWAITDDQDRLFVSMPDAGRVAVIETRSWTVIANLDVGPGPRRLALQPDQAYLWVAVDENEPETSGVSAIRVKDLAVVGRIPTGAGSHDIAFSEDSRFAFVTNKDAGSLSVLDVRTLRKARDVAAGASPVSVEYSELAAAAYVASDADGAITAVDGRVLEIVARTEAEPGIVQIRVPPGGRFGFLPNPANDTVSILDLSANRIVQTAKVMEGPDQITFTDENAYIRHRDSDTVLMIPLGEIGNENEKVPLVDIPGGQNPLGQTSQPSLADAIVQASGAYAALIANPADKAIYYYREGMAAPMGNFSNYGRTPRAVLVVERNLREREPGLYETSVMLRRPGEYRLAFYLDVPQIIHCFELRVETEPTRQAARSGPRVAVEPLHKDRHFAVGRPLELSFRLTDAASGAPLVDIEDATVLVFSPAWQTRSTARHQGDGIYAVALAIPRPGFYSVLVEVPSMRLPYTKQFTLADDSMQQR